MFPIFQKVPARELEVYVRRRDCISVRGWPTRHQARRDMHHHTPRPDAPSAALHRDDAPRLPSTTASIKAERCIAAERCVAGTITCAGRGGEEVRGQVPTLRTSLSCTSLTLLNFDAEVVTGRGGAIEAGPHQTPARRQ